MMSEYNEAIMTQTAPLEISASTPTVTSAVREPESEVVVRRMTLHGVPWPLYEQLLALVGEGLPRLTYDRGTLEMQMLSETHEAMRWIAGRFIEVFADESGIIYKALGSTTWHRQEIEGGLEADESYYIQSYPRVRDHRIDLAVDPPPDLAIEIDLSPPDVEKASIYARLGVPEIWRWRRGRLVVLVLRSDGTYIEAQRSVALPDFPLDELAAALAHPQADSPTVANFRRILRERKSRG
jgi:Uma2 family endonuclease